MSNPTLRAAILVVSTTASKDASTDATGPILKDVFDQEGGGKWEVTETKIVGDVVLEIQRAVTAWADQEDAVNVIISTGGTGFAIQDITPEVCFFIHVLLVVYSPLRPSPLYFTNKLLD